MRTDYVYFVKAQNGLIKIGRSERDPKRRLAMLRAMSPVALEPVGILKGDAFLERRLHQMFDGDRDHGEWFRPSPRLLYFVRRWTHLWTALDTIDEVIPEPETMREVWERYHNPLPQPPNRMGVWSPKSCG